MSSDTIKTGVSSHFVFILVYLYSIFVLIRPHEYIPILMGIPIQPILLILAAFIWLFFGRKAFYVSQHKLILLFLIILSLSPLLQGWAGGISIAFTKFYPVVIFYYILVAALNDSEKLRKFYWLMVTAAVVMSLHGIDQDINGVGWSGALPVMDGRITYVGIFNDPNDLGNFFVVSLPPLFYFYGYYKSTIVRLILIPVSSLIFYGIYLTSSRGAILGVAGMLWTYLAVKYGSIRAVIVTALFLPVLFLGPSRVAEINPNEESAAGRVEAWFAGLEMLTNSKLLGVGYGGFVDHHHLTAHNSFVLVFAELGLFGYFIWLSFLFLTIFMAFKILMRAMRKSKNDRSESEALAFPIFYSLIGFCVTAFFLSRSYNVLLYLLAALSVSNYINIVDEVTITFSNYFWKLVLFTIGSIFFFFITVKVLLNL